MRKLEEVFKPEEKLNKIKLPKIIPELKITRDLVINELTDLTIILENEGEGDAFHIQLNVNIPPEIEIIDGNPSLSLEKISPGQSVEHKLTIRCMSATGDVTVDISANLNFYDQLQTKQSMIVGPYELTFREVSISKELSNLLSQTSTKVKELLQNMSQIAIYPSELIDILTKETEIIVEKANSALKEEKFDHVKGIIETLEEILDNFQTMTKEDFYAPIIAKRNEEVKQEVMKAKKETEEQLRQEYEKRIAELKEEHEKEIEKIKATAENEKEELRKNFEQRLTEEQEKLKTQLITEKQQEFQELMKELDSKHKAELEELKGSLIKEKERALKELERKFESEKQKALEEQETLLREEFQQQLSELQETKR